MNNRSNGIRLNKYLSSCSIASRRKSEQYILTGRVKVNGLIVTNLATFVKDSDVVEVDGKKINKSKKIYIIFNKPENTVCSKKDYNNRKTIYDIIKINDLNIFSIGRLDYKSSGLLILTNDGDFSNNLAHPSKLLVKEYTVEIDYITDQIFHNLATKFKNGIKIEGTLYKAVELKKVNKNTVKVYIIEGKKREIRVVFNYFNIKIKRLCRTKIGNMDIKKLSLKEGEYIFLSKEEILKLIYG